jgi:hypothetical protein
MPHDATLVHQAMASAAPIAGGAMAQAFAAFAEIGLGDAERLTAIASAVAAAAVKRHGEGAADFIRHLHDMTRLSVGLGGGSTAVPLRRSQIEQGIALLDSAFDGLAASLAAAGLPPAQTTIVETVLLARLLAAHRPNAIRAALLAASHAIARPGYRAGDVIPALVAEVPAAGDAKPATKQVAYA